MKSIKIYVAGTFEDQKILREMGSKLWELGHEVTGTWLHEVAQPEVMTSTEFKRKLAIKDIAEVYRADLVILDNRQKSGGKNVEFGVGLGQFQTKLLWLVGEPSNVFHYLADRTFETWKEVLDELRG